MDKKEGVEGVWMATLHGKTHWIPISTKEEAEWLEANKEMAIKLYTKGYNNGKGDLAVAIMNGKRKEVSNDKPLDA